MWLGVNKQAISKNHPQVSNSRSLRHISLLDGCSLPAPIAGPFRTKHSLKCLLNQELSNKKLYLASSDVGYGYLEDVAADMQADFAIIKNRLYQTRQKNKLTFKVDHILDDHGNSYIQGSPEV